MCSNRIKEVKTKLKIHLLQCLICTISFPSILFGDSLSVQEHPGWQEWEQEWKDENKPTRLFIEGSGGVGILMLGFGMGWSGNLGIELRRFQLYVGGGWGGAMVFGESMEGTYLSSGIRYMFQDVGAKGMFGIQAHYYLKHEGGISMKGGKMTPLPVSIIAGNFWDIGEYFRIGGCGVLGGPEVLTFRALLNILIPL